MYIVQMYVYGIIVWTKNQVRWKKIDRQLFLIKCVHLNYLQYIHSV